jgi:hypothetical protein
MDRYVCETEYLTISNRPDLFAKIEVVSDSDPVNPRKEWDNVGTMICFHNRYDLGDDHNFPAETARRELAAELDDTVKDRIEYWENGNGWSQIDKQYSDWRAAGEAVEEKIEEIVSKVLEAKVIMLPLYLYDHSGITMNVGGFSCNWDSGMVGFIYCTKEKAVEEWGNKVCTKSVREKAIKCLKGEVEVYDQYLTGDVWGFEATVFKYHDGVDPDEAGYDEDYADELGEDSCWGFFGSDYCLEEGKSNALSLMSDFATVADIKAALLGTCDCPSVKQDCFACYVKSVVDRWPSEGVDKKDTHAVAIDFVKRYGKGNPEEDPDICSQPNLFH